MAEVQKVRFEFTVEGQPADRFQVIDFQGQDELSKPYSFLITLACRAADVPPAQVVRRRAALRFLGEQGGAYSYSGVVFSFQYVRSRKDLSLYRAVLSPSLRLLSLTQHNQIFLGQTLPDILAAVFKECGLTRFDLRLKSAYQPLEYVCQYNETALNFVSRLMEHAGLYYYFEEDGQGELLVVTDSRLAHVPIPGGPLLYLPPSGLDHGQRESKVNQLVCEYRIVPEKVVLKDYNYQRPELDLMAEAPVTPDGVGTYYNYGDHFQTVEEGKALAAVRAEELLTGQEVFVGAATVPMLRAGALFSLTRHPAAALNAQYLLVSVEHHGRDKTPLTSGLEDHATASDEENFFRNTFRAISAERQFRPPREAQKTRIHGQLHAVIDAEGSGQYAMIDPMGRYKVRLPFDLAGRPEAKASHWLRLSEPYAGSDHGMHFPLHKGSEVLLSFINADPDRPVIATAMFNGANPNLVKDANNALNAIKTAGNNQIVLGDTKGQEFIGLYSPFHKSSISIGSTKPGGGGSLDFKTEGGTEWFVVGDENKAVAGTSNEAVVGAKTELNLGLATEMNVGYRAEYNFGPHLEVVRGDGLELGSESLSLFRAKEMNAYDSVELKAGVSPALSAAMESIKKSYHLAAAATAAASVGTSFVSESFSDDGCFKGEGGDIHEGMGYGGAAILTLSAIALGAAVYSLNSSLRKINSNSANAWVSTMEMDDQGIRMEVCGANKLPGHSVRKPIVLESVLKPAVGFGSSSFISLENDSTTVKIVNMEPDSHDPAKATKEPAFILLSNAKLLTMEVPDVGSVNLDGTDAAHRKILIRFHKKAGMLCEANRTSIFAPAMQSQMAVFDDRAVMMVADPQQVKSKVELNQDKLILAYSKLDAGAIKVDASGKVMLGGDLEVMGKVSADLLKQWANEPLGDQAPVD